MKTSLQRPCMSGSTINSFTSSSANNIQRSKLHLSRQKELIAQTLSALETFTYKNRCTPEEYASLDDNHSHLSKTISRSQLNSYVELLLLAKKHHLIPPGKASQLIEGSQTLQLLQDRLPADHINLESSKLKSARISKQFKDNMLLQPWPQLEVFNRITSTLKGRKATPYDLSSIFFSTAPKSIPIDQSILRSTPLHYPKLHALHQNFLDHRNNLIDLLETGDSASSNKVYSVQVNEMETVPLIDKITDMSLNESNHFDDYLFKFGRPSIKTHNAEAYETHSFSERSMVIYDPDINNYVRILTPIQLMVLQSGTPYEQGIDRSSTHSPSLLISYKYKGETKWLPLFYSNRILADENRSDFDSLTSLRDRFCFLCVSREQYLSINKRERIINLGGNDLYKALPPTHLCATVLSVTMQGSNLVVVTKRQHNQAVVHQYYSDITTSGYTSKTVFSWDNYHRSLRYSYDLTVIDLNNLRSNIIVDGSDPFCKAPPYLTLSNTFLRSTAKYNRNEPVLVAPKGNGFTGFLIGPPATLFRFYYNISTYTLSIVEIQMGRLIRPAGIKKLILSKVIRLLNNDDSLLLVFSSDNPSCSYTIFGIYTPLQSVVLHKIFSHDFEEIFVQQTVKSRTIFNIIVTLPVSIASPSVVVIQCDLSIGKFRHTDGKACRLFLNNRSLWAFSPAYSVLALYRAPFDPSIELYSITDEGNIVDPRSPGLDLADMGSANLEKINARKTHFVIKHLLCLKFIAHTSILMIASLKGTIYFYDVVNNKIVSKYDCRDVSTNINDISADISSRCISVAFEDGTCLVNTF